MKKFVGLLVAAVALLSFESASRAQQVLKVSSYDPTVELYKALNPQFEAYYKAKTGQEIKVQTDHGPSGKQARDIAAGKESDVAALSVDVDIDAIAKSGLLSKQWRKEYPNNSVPYYSSVVFLVRKGNPKQIKDWEDLARPEVVSLAPNPKTGGGARWIYLAAYAHALRKGENEQQAKEFVGKIYDDAILDPAMRSSTVRFVQQKEGDVLFGWENEILQIVNDPASKSDYELVTPKDSIIIEVPIAVVTDYAKKHGVEQPAKSFVDYLYSDDGQRIIAKFYNRPFNEKISDEYKDQFAKLDLYRFAEYFKDWPTVMKTHFAEGGILDQVRRKR